MTRAIILAGGKGERLEPLTLEMPKVLIPFRGRTLLDQVIDLYFKYNVYEIWFALGHKWQQIKEKFPTHPIITENTPRGTGGWLNIIKSIPESRKLFTESFYVNNGDNLLNVDLQKMMEHHKRTNAVATIACVKSDDIREYGSVGIKTDFITHFKEKQHSPKPKKGYINSGYYIFSPEIFDYVPETDGPVSLELDVFPKIAKAGKLAAFVTDGQWFDSGTMERYKSALQGWQGV